MNAARFLWDLYSELEQIEQAIRVLEHPEDGIGPALSRCELDAFRRNNLTAIRGSERMSWLQ